MERKRRIFMRRFAEPEVFRQHQVSLERYKQYLFIKYLRHSTWRNSEKEQIHQS